jgi:hypothetical protein
MEDVPDPVIMEDVPDPVVIVEDEPILRDEPRVGRPRARTTPFALRRAEYNRKRPIRNLAKLSVEKCTPKPNLCRCTPEPMHGFSVALVQQLRAYLQRIGADNTASERAFMTERIHVNRDKLADPQRNLSNVRLHTYMIEKPSVLAPRLVQVMASANTSIRLPLPSRADMIVVCANTFFHLCGRSRSFFYTNHRRKRSREVGMTVQDRLVSPVRERRRPINSRMCRRKYYLLQWIEAEVKRHLNDPTGGLTDVQTILPYKNKQEAHAYYVIEAEQNIDGGTWEHTADASALYFNPDSELMALHVLDEDPESPHVCDGDQNECSKCHLDLADCSCQVGVEYSENSPAPTNNTARYGNRLLGQKMELPVHEDICCYSYFIKAWANNAEFARVKLRKHMPFAKCDVCVKNEESRSMPMTDRKRREHLKFYAAHLNFVRREREAYYHNCKLARQDPEHFLSIILDAADASDYAMPHTKTRTHASSACHKIKMHLMGGLVHGRDTYLWTVPPHIAQGHNISIQALHQILVDVKKKEGKLPKCLFLQLDNTTKQNKGEGLFGYLAVLLHLRIFDQVYVNFLPVGHTHEDIDQIFSRISVHLRFVNAPTLGKLHAELRRSVKKYGKQPIVAHWPYVQNTSAYLAQKMVNTWTSDITLYYAFRVQLGVLPSIKGKVIVQARTYPGSKHDDPEDRWRGFRPDTPWVLPFASAVPNFLRDRDSIPKQAVAKHVTDEGDGYTASIDVQAESIRKFMASMPHIFNNHAKACNERLFEKLRETSVEYVWPEDEMKYLYVDPEEVDPAHSNQDANPSLFDSSLGFFQPVLDPVEDEEKDHSVRSFAPEIGEQNVQCIEELKKGSYYLMRSDKETQFRVVKVLLVLDEEKAAHVQYWECSTNTPDGVDKSEGNKEEDIDLVMDPWHANATHMVTGRYNSLPKHTFSEFIDLVEMTSWSKSKAEKEGGKKFKKKLFVQSGTKLIRIQKKHRARAQTHWMHISDMASGSGQYRQAPSDQSDPWVQDMRVL